MDYGQIPTKVGILSDRGTTEVEHNQVFEKRE